LWSAAAVWVKEGPGTGKALAEWMVHGESEIDLHSSDIARFHEHQKTRAHVRARAAEGFNKTYGIVHPNEQWASNRNIRLAPFHARERELGAVFFEAAGWERPRRCSARRGARWTFRSDAWSTRRCSAPTAASSRTSRSCGWATSTSGWSPVARRAWRTRNGSATRWWLEPSSRT